MTVGFGTQYIDPVLKASKSFFRSYADFVLGVEQNEVFAEELTKAVRGVKDPVTKKYTGGNGFTNLKGDMKTAWKSSKKVVEGKSLWTVIKESFTKMPDEFKALGKEAKVWGKTKGGLKVISKRMPLIGNLVFAALELPNIFKAFTDKKGGVGTGVLETGKAGLKFGAYAAGAAIGQALIPIPLVGGLIGGYLGGLLADTVLGKSFTEKQEEETEKGKMVDSPINAKVPEGEDAAAIDPKALAAAQSVQPAQSAQATALPSQQEMLAQSLQPSMNSKYPMSNQFNYSMPQLSSSPSGGFDMDGDLMGQSIFGPKGASNNQSAFNNNKFAKQQFA